MASNTAALAYEEPGIVTILILASFLLLLSVVNWIVDRIVYCGLLGQILLGVAWGTPGANWLSLEVQDTVMQLGYLGLILIVYEGGLSTNLKMLKANLILSATVALIGISCPIAISFVLQGLLPITPVQAFAAGAALCSTSLGTTFTVLATSGLGNSRLGVVLTSAAMMDDVVGLIMVQVISNLGTSSSSFSAVTVIRPVFVSIGFALILPALCLWVVKPVTAWYYRADPVKNSERVRHVLARPAAAWALHTAVLVALVTGASYAGTSNLFAAYLAGASITWWHDLCGSLSGEQEQQQTDDARRAQSTVTGTPQAIPAPSVRQEGQQGASTEPTESGKQHEQEATSTAVAIYERYYAPAVQTILKPFFFASIGFSIPITKMFSGGIVWRGFVYAALMTIGKLLCGAFLVRFSGGPGLIRGMGKVVPAWLKKKKSGKGKGTGQVKEKSQQIPDSSGAVQATNTDPPRSAQPSSEATTPSTQTTTAEANISRKRTTSKLPKPRSLYPAAILGSAMVARGEIGFLISSVAESKGVYGGGSSSGESSELFLVVTWAILLCTFLGPVTVGLAVRRVKRLQEMERSKRTGKEDPLGIWGVNGAT